MINKTNFGKAIEKILTNLLFSTKNLLKVS